MAFLDKFREVRNPSIEDIQHIEQSMETAPPFPLDASHQKLQADRKRGLANFAMENLVMYPHESQSLQNDALAKQDTGEMPVVKLPKD